MLRAVYQFSAVTGVPRTACQIPLDRQLPIPTGVSHTTRQSPIPSGLITAAIAIALCALAAQAQEHPAQTRLPEAAVELPLQMVSEQPAVEVRINGAGPFLFLIDTGAAGCGRIQAALSERLKLPEAGEVEIGDPSGRNSRTAKRVRAEQLELGGASFRDLLLLRRDQVEPDSGPREKVQGIVGIGLFADALVTLDYPAGRLRIARGELPPPDGRDVLAFTNDRGIPNIALAIDDVQLRADVDSGSMGMLTVPGELVDKLQLARPPVVVGRARTSFNEFELKESRLKGDFRLGRHVFASPPITFSDLLPHGNLGSALLRHFAVTIDQQNKRIRFARAGDEAIRIGPRYRVGVAFTPGSDGFVVREVAPGSAGAAAGLKAGDRILRVNSKPVAEVSDADLRTLFGRPDVVHLTIERDGASRELELTPKATE